MFEKFFEKLRQRHDEEKFNASVIDSIEFIVENDPRVPNIAIHLCGYTRSSPHGANMKAHAFYIGDNMWIGRTFRISDADAHLIMLAEPDSLMKDATIVFDNKVLIKGSWTKHVLAKLADAVKAASDEKLRVEASMEARDRARANAY